MTSILGSQPPRPPLGPPPAPSFFPPLSGRYLEPLQQSTAQPRPPPPPPLKLNGFIGVPPAPSAPPLSPNDYFLLGAFARSVSPAPRPFTATAPPLSPPSNNLYGSQTQLLTREKEEIKYAVQKELGNKIYELPDDPPELELGDGLANILEPEAKDI